MSAHSSSFDKPTSSSNVFLAKLMSTYNNTDSKPNIVISGVKKIELSSSVANNVYYYEYELAQKLIQNSSGILLNPIVEYVYNPIDYAKDTHLKFLNMYCNGSKKLLFLGMNPGPWGMMQTGIPFGEVNIVKNWLNIDGQINGPSRQHPSRPVTGFNCHRSEISGKRFWEFVKQISSNNPSNFFKHSFIYNYFPLGLLTKTGKNITPADFKVNDQRSIHTACDEALYKIVLLLQVEVIIAIGRFAEKRAIAALKAFHVSNVNMAEFMEDAFTLARQALNMGEVPVGCVFVHNGVIIAQGKNAVNETGNATRHAEVVCMDQIVSKYDEWAKVLKETEVIVTVEPCIMCAALLYDLQVKCITYGCVNDRFGGVDTVLVTSNLYANPCPVQRGIRADEAMDLLKTFYKGTNPNAPDCKVKIKNKLV